MWFPFTRAYDRAGIPSATDGMKALIERDAADWRRALQLVESVALEAHDATEADPYVALDQLDLSYIHPEDAVGAITRHRLYRNPHLDRGSDESQSDRYWA